MEYNQILKNRNKAFKVVAGFAGIAMCFSLTHASLTHIQLKKYIKQKENIVNSYKTEESIALKEFKEQATEEDLEAYNLLLDKEKASRNAFRDDLSTAGVLTLVLSATGYAKLLNDELIRQNDSAQKNSTSNKTVFNAVKLFNFPKTNPPLI